MWRARGSDSDGVTLRSALWVTVAAIASALLPATATASRPPTTGERGALKAALTAMDQVAITPQWIRISTASPGWAGVGYGPVSRRSFLVFHLAAKRWRPVGSEIDKGESFDSDCAYMPPAAVTDLFAIVCPPYQALHARRAGRPIEKTVTAALQADPTVRRNGGDMPGSLRISNVCVSRLDSHWAGASLSFPDTGLYAWLHLISNRWHVLLSWGAQRPPRTEILALAACVGYSAADFGA